MDKIFRNNRHWRICISAILATSLAYIFWEYLGNFDSNWMHPEMGMYIPNALYYGLKPHWKDLLLSFDWLHFDGAPRARFLSNFILIESTKFRLFCMQFFPPHPSFSLNWIFSLLLTPPFLYKLVKNLSGYSVASLVALSLYFLCPGFLGGINMLYHPAKPLTNFLYIFCLWCGSELYLALNQQGQFRTSEWRLYGLLCGILFLGCFADESAYFLFALIPILFPEIFKQPSPYRYRLFSYYLAAILGFFLVVTVFAPLLINSIGVGNFRFWSWAVESNHRLLSFSLLEPLFYNGVYLLWGHFIPFTHGYGSFQFNALSISAVALFLAYLYSCYLRQNDTGKMWVKRLLIALGGFLIFQTLLLTRHLSIIKDSYYYGGPFSIFLILILALLLSPKGGWRGVVNLSFVVLLMFVMEHNYRLTNDAWRGKRADEPPVTYQVVRGIWERRYDEAYLRQIESKIEPPRLRTVVTEILTSVRSTPAPQIAPQSPYLNPSIPQP